MAADTWLALAGTILRLQGTARRQGEDTMIEVDTMFEVIVLGAVTVVPLVAAGGLRRWPWRYAGLWALGWVVVIAAVRLSVEQIDPGLLVWLGALGGALATLGSERGERERVRISASILASRPSSLDSPPAGNYGGVPARDGAQEAR